MKRRRSSIVLKALIDRRMATRERVSQGRILRPVGNLREVVFDETCENPRLVSTSTPSASSAPDSLVPVLGVQGGSGLVAIESTIQGQAAGSEAQGHTIPAGLLPLTSFVAVDVKSTTTLGLAFYAGMSFVSVKQSSVAVAAGTVDIERLSGRMHLIRGDSDLPDHSLAFFSSSGISAGPWQLHTVDIDAGTVRSATISLKTDYDEMKVVRGLDYYSGKLRFLVWQRRDSDAEVPGGTSEVEVYSADTLLTSVTVEQTITMPTSSSEEPVSWGRLGDFAQLIRINAGSLSGIDKIQLTGIGSTLGSSRILPLDSNPVNQEKCHAVNTDSGGTFFVMESTGAFPLDLILVKVQDGGNGVDLGWPTGFLVASEIPVLGSEFPLAFKRAFAGPLVLSHVFKGGAGTDDERGVIEGTADGVFDTVSVNPVEVPEVPSGFEPDFMLPK